MTGQFAVAGVQITRKIRVYPRASAVEKKSIICCGPFLVFGELCFNLSMQNLGCRIGRRELTRKAGLPRLRCKRPLSLRSCGGRVGEGEFREKMYFTKTKPIFWWPKILASHYRITVYAKRADFLSWVRSAKRTGVNGFVLRQIERLMAQNDTDLASFRSHED